MTSFLRFGSSCASPAGGGRLVDDFLIVKGKNSIHVCNAPSPAATASLEIGRFITANQLPKVTSAHRPRRIYLANQHICRVNDLA